MSKFVISKSSNEKYYVSIKASNGQTVFTTEMYETKDSAMHAIDFIRGLEHDIPAVDETGE